MKNTHTLKRHYITGKIEHAVKKNKTCATDMPDSMDSIENKNHDEDEDDEDENKDKPTNNTDDNDDKSLTHQTGTQKSVLTVPQLIMYDFSTNESFQINNISNSPRNNNNDNDDDDEDEDKIQNEEEEIVEKTFVEISHDINTLDDLIAVGRLFEEHDYKYKKYSVNIEGLYKMIPALEEFKALIGMNNNKKHVVDQIVYLSGKCNHIQFSTKSATTSDDNVKVSSSKERSLLETLLTSMSKSNTSSKQYNMSESVTNEDNNYDMFHTVIFGPPGVGKTAFAKVLARIFLSLGITDNETFRVARRSDLIGEYVGHTATKTQKVIDESLGGVLFIDEIYSLGNGGAKENGKSDSFSIECINTLNQNLTEQKGKFICIIAGYKEETEKYFFGLNPGLKRRFSFYYNINGYNWIELTKILFFKINKLEHWSCDNSLAQKLLDTQFIKDKMTYFSNYAGDVETWLLNIKIAHCKRVFGKAEVLQRCITYDDIIHGFNRFKTQKDINTNPQLDFFMKHLYT